jgi:hypothetical protein
MKRNRSLDSTYRRAAKSHVANIWSIHHLAWLAKAEIAAAADHFNFARKSLSQSGSLMGSSRARETIFQITLGRQVSLANDKSQQLISGLLLDGRARCTSPPTGIRKRFILLCALFSLACEGIHPRR